MLRTCARYETVEKPRECEQCAEGSLKHSSAVHHNLAFEFIKQRPWCYFNNAVHTKETLLERRQGPVLTEAATNRPALARSRICPGVFTAGEHLPYRLPPLEHCPQPVAGDRQALFPYSADLSTTSHVLARCTIQPCTT